MDAKDRDQIALYIQDIEIDHRPGPDGTLIDDVRVYFGKKGTANYQQIYWASRLPRDNAMLWERFGPTIEKWKESRKIDREGLPLEAWHVTKAQIKACHDLGMFTVEDIATATDSIRQKLGMGASDLIAKAKAFLENKERSANAGKIAKLEEAVAQLQEQLKESTETNKALAAELKAKKPRQERAAA
jgi:hypothetical protein